MVKFSEYYLSNSYKNCIILEVENKGLFDVTVEEVYINDRVTPSKVELGISKTLHQIDGTDDNEFYDINERYKISPKPDTKKIKETLQQDKNNTVINYGIRIFDNSYIEKVIIKYTYLGISFQYIEEIWFDAFIRDNKIPPKKKQN